MRRRVRRRFGSRLFLRQLRPNQCAARCMSTVFALLLLDLWRQPLIGLVLGRQQILERHYRTVIPVSPAMD